MKPGQASVTAQRVAAHRLTFTRVAAPYGDPAADDALARDVAASASVGPGPMRDYLRARTRFFDGVVTHALRRGCTQVVIGAAGYDGRALRYGKPGVLWFEADHPATQQDKRARLDRLGIRAGHIRFVAADFSTDPVAGPLGLSAPSSMQRDSVTHKLTGRRAARFLLAAPVIAARLTRRSARAGSSCAVRRRSRR